MRKHKPKHFDTAAADAIFAKATQLAAEKNWTGAVAAGTDALRRAEGKDYERYGRWKDAVDEWRVHMGNGDDIKSWIVRHVLRKLPVWVIVLLLALSGAVSICCTIWGDPATWWSRYVFHREVSRLLEEGVRAMDSGQWEEAGNIFKEAVERRLVDARLRLGQHLTLIYDNADGAYRPDAFKRRLAELQRNTSSNPLLRPHVCIVEGNLLYHTCSLNAGSGKVNVETCRYADAAAKYREAIKLAGPDRVLVEAHFGLAVVLASKGDLQGAASEYKTVLKKYPDNQKALSGLATLLSALGEYAQARKQYETILTQGNTRIQERLELATVLRIQGNLDAALREQTNAETYFNSRIENETDRETENHITWGLLVYSRQPGPPWPASKQAHKQYYINRNRAATECLIADTPGATAVPGCALESLPDIQDRQSIDNLIHLELQAVYNNLYENPNPEMTEIAARVPACIAWLHATSPP